MNSKEIENEIYQLQQARKDIDARIRLLKDQRATAFNDELPDKIKRYEDRYPRSEWSIHALVRVGETLAEWTERHGKHCRGARDPKWPARQYEYEKEGTGYYLQWLFKTDDPRILDTIAYARYKGNYQRAEEPEEPRVSGVIPQTPENPTYEWHVAKYERSWGKTGMPFEVYRSFFMQGVTPSGGDEHDELTVGGTI